MWIANHGGEEGQLLAASACLEGTRIMQGHGATESEIHQSRGSLCVFVASCEPEMTVCDAHLRAFVVCLGVQGRV